MTTRPGTKQASFNAGELAEEVWDRSDVKQFYAGAAAALNVEPVAQGGFRLSPRSLDIGAARGDMVIISGPVAVTGAVLVAPGDVLSIDLGAGDANFCGVSITYQGSSLADAALVAEYRDAGGTWHALAPAYRLATTARQRFAALPPGAVALATGVRLRYLIAGTETITASLTAWREQLGVNTLPAKLVPFTFSDEQTYMVNLGQNIADIYRDGAWIAAAVMPAWPTTVTAPLQRLDTLLLFHNDVPQGRIMRQGADHEWNTDAPQFENIVKVDLGGTYTKTSEVWQVIVRWPTSGSVYPTGLSLSIAVNGEDTPAISLSGSGGIANSTAAENSVRTALEALAGVETGVVVGTASSTAGQITLNVTFDGAGNTGSQFVLSARIVNNAEAGATALRVTKGDPGGEELFSVARGYPACGAFYQDRLVQAGFKAKKGAVLASPTGDYFEASISTLTATAGVLVNIDTDGAEKIHRMARANHLCLFTTDAEYYVSDRVVNATQPQNIVESSRNGSPAGVPIVSNGDGLIYVGKSRSILYQASYDDVKQKYVSDPLSLLASHIVHDVVDLALQRPSKSTDSGRLFLVRSDGGMTLGTIILNQDVTAFSRWQTAGQVKAVAVDGSSPGRVYLIVERLIGGTVRRRVEVLTDGLLFDAAVTGTAAARVVSGLAAAHEGATVWAIADGYVDGPHVVSGGQITLSFAPVNASVTVGRWTAPRVLTLPMPRDIGPRIVLARPMRVHTVQINFLGVTSIAVGANGQAPDDVPLYAAGMAVDQPLAPQTGWHDVTGLEGWSIEGQVEITQVRPGVLRVGSIIVQAKT